MKRAIDLEKRVRIAKAYEENPTLTYLALQQLFKTSSRVVTEALHRPSVEWKALMQGNKLEERHVTRFLGITVRGRAHDGDVDYETQEQGCADWESNNATTLAELLEGYSRRGWS
jgi:hypothetical protein